MEYKHSQSAVEKKNDYILTKIATALKNAKSIKMTSTKTLESADVAMEHIILEVDSFWVEDEDGPLSFADTQDLMKWAADRAKADFIPKH